MYHADPRPAPEALARLGGFQTATIHEALGKAGAMPFGIKPIYPGMSVVGVALTVTCPPRDNLSIHAAIEHGRPGDVLVVDFGGDLEAGPFGDVLATACQAKGIVGIVIDGCLRDGALLRAMGFPAFARGLNMKGTTKKAMGAFNVPITCAGVQVAPGDLVVGDDDGVVVVPRARLAEATAIAARRDADEVVLRAAIQDGASTMDLLNLRGAVAG